MNKFFFILIFILSAHFFCNKKKKNEKMIPVQQIEVLTLGTFHFHFPNLDVAKIKEEEKIDVLDSVYQEEIQNIVLKLVKFQPTKIVIEARPEFQDEYDSLYLSYLQGNHILSRNEIEQIGFRLAKHSGLKKLYCADSWGDDFNSIKEFFSSSDSTAQQEFMDFFYHHPDTLLEFSRNEKKVIKTEGILAELKRINDENELKNSLGEYLIGIFKYETPENKQFGADFTTGWWFNRNLRIFRNIQRIDPIPEDRILVIFGAGHMNLLNLFFDVSPEYKLLKINEFLK